MSSACGEPVFRVAELEIDPAHLPVYRDLLKEEIEASVEAEPGVLMLYALAINGSPTHLRIFEIYADQEAYEAHLSAPHFLKYKALTSGMVRSLRLIEAVPMVLRAKACSPTAPAG